MRPTLPAAALALALASPALAASPRDPIATFSIAARDPATGELGVAVASRFFAVGAVVPWARAGVGAVATQAFANTTFGPRGLDLLAAGQPPAAVLEALLAEDAGRDRRQVGLVAADGASVTYSGPGTTPWAGGRSGPDYAIQGNILAGEKVVAEMERVFLATRGKGSLGERLFSALAAGDRAGGDSRGRQSAALLVVRAGAGYGGFTDRAIDVRVDDHADPFKELKRLLGLALVNDAWNTGWTAFTERRFAEARAAQERAAALAPRNAEVLYDLAVIRLAAGARPEALRALGAALAENPRLKAQAREDGDLAALKGDAAFSRLVGARPNPPAGR
jgi:uncharacterized Ntn-hydrolase superfamily protein